MLPLRRFLFVALISLGFIASSYAQSLDDARLSITKDVMDQIAHDNFPAVVGHFTADLKESLTQDRVSDAVKEVIAIAGPFQKQLSQEMRMADGLPTYVSRSQFEKFKVELGISFDGDNRITHIWIAPVSDLSPESMEASAKSITDLLRQERFDLLSDQFDDQLKLAMTTNHLDSSWSHVIGHLGQFKNIKLAKKDPEYDAVDVRCQFERGEIVVRVAFDLEGKVAFVWMLPVHDEDAPRNKAELQYGPGRFDFRPETMTLPV